MIEREQRRTGPEPPNNEEAAEFLTALDNWEKPVFVDDGNARYWVAAFLNDRQARIDRVAELEAALLSAQDNIHRRLCPGRIEHDHACQAISAALGKNRTP